MVHSTKSKKDSVHYLGGLLQFKSEIVWSSVCFLTAIHLAGFYGAWLSLKQIIQLRIISSIFMYVYGWFAGCFGICIGAHRLWAHKSFKANTPLKVILIIANSVAGQNSCYAWVRDHRIHHKFSDTDADPHNVNRGFFFSHIGWLMMKKHPDITRKGRVINMTDIETDPFISFQRRYFKLLFLVFGVVIPITVPCLLWNETLWNSVFICFFLRYMLLLNITWSINSVAHTFGYRPYDHTVKPAENSIVAFLAHGEGWHNYHHTFPWDYKASDFGMNFNVARIVIDLFAKIGWAYDLKQASEDVVKKRTERTGDETLSKTKTE